MNKLRKKELEALDKIHLFVALNDRPPTYVQLAEMLKISETAAYARCRNIREQMNHHKLTYKQLEGFKEQYDLLFNNLQGWKHCVYQEILDGFKLYGSAKFTEWLENRMKNIEI